MKNIIPSLFALSLLAACASDDARTVTMSRRVDYYQSGASKKTVRAYSEQAMLRSQQASPDHSEALHRQLMWAESDAVDSSNVSISPNSETTPEPERKLTTAAPPRKTVMTQPEPVSTPAKPSTPQPVAERQEAAPFATKVAGRPGYVISPFTPNAGYVDVTGMAPGSEARDPYTGKIFRVP